LASFLASALFLFTYSNTDAISLEKRKEQWRKEKEEKKKIAPDSTIPPGHTLMTDGERRDTLQSLKESMFGCRSTLELLQVLLF
jgi:hypothetical protein